MNLSIVESIFQFRVRAGDQGKPEKYGEASVIITIERDNNQPTFVYSPNLNDYFVTIEETRAVNSVIVSVSATDADNDNRVSIIMFMAVIIKTNNITIL